MGIMNPHTVIGMGTRKFQADNTPVAECSERLTPGCDCCKIEHCDICLEWEVYGETIDFGTAVPTGDPGGEWTGSAGGITFVASWDAYCTFTVQLNGVEVFSAVLCGDYESEDVVTCRNWDGEVSYTDG